MNKPTAQQPQVIPLVAEELTIEKIQQLSARTVIKKSVTEETVPVTVGLRQDAYELSRRVIDQPVLGEAPGVRQEGEQIIIPVFEERVVKQLFVTEEIVLTPRSTVAVHREDVVLRRENIDVERSEL